MIKYKNISSYPLTFYGITFNPNEEKEAPGLINHIKMIRVRKSIEPKPKSIIEVAKAEAKIEEKHPIEEKPKRQYNRRNKNSNQ